MNTDNQNKKNLGKVLPAFYCLKCRELFREMGGKVRSDGDVDQWCPYCGASDDHIHELTEQEQAGFYIPDVPSPLKEPSTHTDLSLPEADVNADDASKQKALSVQPLWCLALPIQQQSVLLLAARGPDGIAKAHPCKDLQRAYRGTVLVAAKYGRCLRWGESADTFMGLDVIAQKMTDWERFLDRFFQHSDDLPHHFLMHLMHGAEIIGYKHPEERFRIRWKAFYFRCVRELHLTEESMEEMDARLSDWKREHWNGTSVGRGNEEQLAAPVNKNNLSGDVEREHVGGRISQETSQGEATTSGTESRKGQPGNASESSASPAQNLPVAAPPVAVEQGEWTYKYRRDLDVWAVLDEKGKHLCYCEVELGAKRIVNTHNSRVAQLKKQILELKEPHKASDLSTTELP